MPHLPCSLWWAPAIARKQNRGANGFCAPSPAARLKCKQSMASGASVGSTSSKSRGCRVTKTRSRSALATPPQANFSSMFMARYWLRCGRPIALELNWQNPDEGMWEVRGGRKHFTHSKMMAWVAFDRAVKLVEECGCADDEHLERWQKIRDQVHAEVCERGYNVEKKAFTQYFGSDALDASLLMMPLTGFLPITDERVQGTIEAIERELMQDGLVLRYRPQEEKVDGLPGREGVFLPCSFCLA